MRNTVSYIGEYFLPILQANNTLVYQNPCKKLYKLFTHYKQFVRFLSWVLINRADVGPKNGPKLVTFVIKKIFAWRNYLDVPIKMVNVVVCNNDNTEHVKNIVSEKFRLFDVRTGVTFSNHWANQRNLVMTLIEKFDKKKLDRVAFKANQGTYKFRHNLNSWYDIPWFS